MHCWANSCPRPVAGHATLPQYVLNPTCSLPAPLPQMLVMCGSKERSAREWGALFQASGWELEEVVPLGLPTKHGIVVGRPV